MRSLIAYAAKSNVVLIPVAAGALYPAFGVLMSPMFAGLAMALSSVSVLANALRLKRFGRRARVEPEPSRPAQLAPAE